VPTDNKSPIQAAYPPEACHKALFAENSSYTSLNVTQLMALTLRSNPPPCTTMVLSPPSQFLSRTQMGVALRPFLHQRLSSPSARWQLSNDESRSPPTPKADPKGKGKAPPALKGSLLPQMARPPQKMQPRPSKPGARQLRQPGRNRRATWSDWSHCG
jgi:hypothetical protein